jgi:hypothetical protein
MELELRVEGGSQRDASQLSDDLLSYLRATVSGASFERRRESAEDMELGTIIVAIMSAPAIVELAKGPALELARGIANWLERRRAKVRIGCDGTILAENVRPEDVVKIVELALSGKQ